MDIDRSQVIRENTGFYVVFEQQNIIKFIFTQKVIEKVYRQVWKTAFKKARCMSRDRKHWSNVP